MRKTIFLSDFDYLIGFLDSVLYDQSGRERQGVTSKVKIFALEVLSNVYVQKLYEEILKAKKEIFDKYGTKDPGTEKVIISPEKEDEFKREMEAYLQRPLSAVFGGDVLKKLPVFSRDVIVSVLEDLDKIKGINMSLYNFKIFLNFLPGDE